MQFCEARIERPSVKVGIQLFLCGKRVGDHESRAFETERGKSLDHTRRLLLVVDAPVERTARVGEVEPGEAERAEADDGHAEGLQVL